MKDGVCPHCGYCEHCGRGGHQGFSPYPWYPAYPYWSLTDPSNTYTTINTPYVGIMTTDSATFSMNGVTIS